MTLLPVVGLYIIGCLRTRSDRRHGSMTAAGSGGSGGGSGEGVGGVGAGVVSSDVSGGMTFIGMTSSSWVVVSWLSWGGDDGDVFSTGLSTYSCSGRCCGGCCQKGKKFSLKKTLWEITTLSVSIL